MKNGARCAMIILSLLVPLGASAVVNAADALPEVERALVGSSLSVEQRAAIAQRSREAIDAGVPAEDVLAIVKGGAAQGMDAAAVVTLLAQVADARKQGLTIRPLVNIIEQGIAKRVSFEKIAAAVERARANVDAARTIVREAEEKGLAVNSRTGRTAAMERVAGALERGVPAGDIRDLGSKATEVKITLAQFGRAVESAANLKELGMPQELALKMARRALILGYSERGFARLEREIMTRRRSGMSWQETYREMSTDMEGGGRDMGVMRGPGSDAGGVGGPGPGGRSLERR